MLLSLLFVCLFASQSLAVPIIGKIPDGTDPENNPDLFEGDIVGITAEELKNGVTDRTLLWPNGIIYYNIAPNTFTTNQVNTLLEAFRQYEANSCLRFVERTNERNYVHVMQSGGGCYSYIGMTGGAQDLSLDDGCFRCDASGANCKPGTPIHEFLHASGFYHEQSRTDRDDFVTINYSNIQAGAENNFNKYTASQINDQGVAYDYGSVMHYGAYAFAQDPTIRTIIPLDNTAVIGQRNGFSASDLQKLNTLYRCP